VINKYFCRRYTQISADKTQGYRNGLDRREWRHLSWVAFFYKSGKMEDIAVIARHRRDREQQFSPLIHTDNTDKANSKNQTLPRINADGRGSEEDRGVGKSGNQESEKQKPANHKGTQSKTGCEGTEVYAKLG
jgi:hypothetical protein